MIESTRENRHPTLGAAILRRDTTGSGWPDVSRRLRPEFTTAGAGGGDLSSQEPALGDRSIGP
jgi:hypothetical protein